MSRHSAFSASGGGRGRPARNSAKGSFSESTRYWGNVSNRKAERRKSQNARPNSWRTRTRSDIVATLQQDLVALNGAGRPFSFGPVGPGPDMGMAATRDRRTY